MKGGRRGVMEGWMGGEEGQGMDGQRHGEEETSDGVM